MAKLIEKLPLPERRTEIVDACCRLLDQEVARKKGLTGLAVKAGYKVLNTLKSGAVRAAIDGLFDDFIGALEPFHAEYEKAGSRGDFGATLKPRAAAVAEALVCATDRRAERTRHASLKRAYQTLRPTAVRNVQEAVPALADLIDRFYQE